MFTIINDFFAFELSVLIQNRDNSISDDILIPAKNHFSHIKQVGSSENIIEILKQYNYDLILLDDIELIQSIRELDKNIEIYCTCDYEDKERFFELMQLDIECVTYLPIDRTSLSNIFKRASKRIIMKKENIELNKKLDIRYSERMQKIIHHSDRQGKQLKELNKELSKHKEILEHGIKEATNDIFELNNELKFAQFETLEILGAISENHSLETSNHIKRVSEYSCLLGELYGLNTYELDLLKIASPMHDIGKIAVSRDILAKPSSLTKEEFDIVKTHPQVGYELLKNSKSEFLQLSATISYEHHEKWDGTGYPRGIKGEEISIFARITTVCDVFDALGATRAYKKPWSNEKLIAFFREQKAKHFDPILTDILLENIEGFFVIKEKYKDN